MKTNSIAKRTKLKFPDPVQDIIDIPRPIVALAREYPDGHVIPLHQHHRSQLLYASSGVMTVTTVRGLWVVPPLRAVWVPALTEHQIHASGKLSMRNLYIKADTITGLPQECCVVSIPPLLRELILYAVKVPPLYKPKSLDDRILTIILELIQTLKVAPLELPIPRDARLQRIFQALTENPADNCSLEQWGRKVGAASRTLARIFQSNTRMSFRQWRQQIRILEALKRLAGNHSVTAVALDLGYDSPSAFIAMFRKAMGTTPGKYFKG
jgi:AraC-like DNA-binding protein